MQLVIDSKFRPFAFDELIKPALLYKEAYDKVEADYSNLAAQTEQWKDIANQTQSPEAYAMYSKYANDLNSAVDDFSRGMTLQNRGNLLNMKKRYASDIIPIVKADAAMKEANDLRVKAGPDAIFEVGEYNSLDQFLHGKKANNKYTSRDALTKRTAAMTEAAMASALRDPEFKKVLGNQYWMLTQHTGGSYEDLKAAIANNPQAQNRFAEIKAQVMKDAGYDRYDASGKQAIEDAINTGLYAGLDKPARSFQANQAYLNPLQAEQLSQAKTEFEWKKQDRQPKSVGNNQYLDPTNGLIFTVDSKGKRIYNIGSSSDPNGGRTSNSNGSKAGSGGRKTATTRADRITEPVQVRINGKQQVEIEARGEDVDDTEYNVVSWDKLTTAQRKAVKDIIGNDTPSGYEILYKQDNGGWFNSTKDDLIILRPKKGVTLNSEDPNQL